jgi:hypothetical protein
MYSQYCMVVVTAGQLGYLKCNTLTKINPKKKCFINVNVCEPFITAGAIHDFKAAVGAVRSPIPCRLGLTIIVYIYQELQVSRSTILLRVFRVFTV